MGKGGGQFNFGDSEGKGRGGGGGGVKMFTPPVVGYRYLLQISPISGRVRLGPIQNKNNRNNESQRLFGSYSYSGIPGFPFRLFCSQEQNSRNIFQNIFLFQNIPNERALNVIILFSINLPAFYHECRSLIGYATHYLFCDR